MKKRLERDEENVVVTGVIAGLANYFGQDPKLFRLLAIAFLIVTGFFPGVLIYFAAWMMIPRRKRMNEAQDMEYEVVE